LNPTEYLNLVSTYVSADELIEQEIMPEVKGKEVKDIEATARKMFDDEIVIRREYKKKFGKTTEIGILTAEILLLAGLQRWVIEKIKSDPNKYKAMLERANLGAT